MTKKMEGTAQTAPYDMLADEYYDEVAHPTCLNLNSLSRRFIESRMPSSAGSLDILEVGAGSSTVAPLIRSQQASLERLTLHDQSEKMLSWSRRWAELGATLQVSNALDMASATDSVDVLVAGLGDPYNVDDFWAEAARVCRHGATLLFTMPSYEWASRYRLGSRSQELAEFRLRSGRNCFVPSFVNRLDQQVRLIQSNGWVLSEFESLGLESLPAGQPISNKANVFHGIVSSLVWGFRARRQAK